MSRSIVLGGGCFWCVEAAYRRINGILDARSGYAGGHVENPSYRDVCGGRTGHAEVVRITFDPDVISEDQVLDFFWEVHDPTTLNRQGNDVGPQYRSIILYSDEQQRDRAQASLERAKERFSSPIVTEVEPLGAFYPAEDYHNDYYELNPNQGYCRLIIQPKLKKLGLDVEPRR